VIRVETDASLLEAAEDGRVAPLERVPLEPETANLVLSPLSLHLTNDTPGVLIQIARTLRPDGLFLAAVPGAGTLGELREALLGAESELSGAATPRIVPFADVRDAGALLQRAGFALPVTDIETYTARYDDMFALIRDLRAMGMQNPLSARSRQPAPRALFLRAAEIYAERFADPDGRIRATFDVVSLSGWAPHESQQQPLKPGSARTRLADALGSREQSAGEKAGE
jgi:SAM-dependent methyltransferase